VVRHTPGEVDGEGRRRCERADGTLAAMSFGAGLLRGAGGSLRGVVDHRLARRAVIAEYRKGRLARHQVCDAHPELIRAARQVGRPTESTCPICEEHHLVLVTYVFGPRLPAHGRCVTTAKEMHQLNRRVDQLAAYVVEVCPQCTWHHLLRVLPVGGRMPGSSSGVAGS
jgi:hypothetical protein